MHNTKLLLALCPMPFALSLDFTGYCLLKFRTPQVDGRLYLRRVRVISISNSVRASQEFIYVEPSVSPPLAGGDKGEGEQDNNLKIQ
jgi:hypothetical protein